MTDNSSPHTRRSNRAKDGTAFTHLLIGTRVVQGGLERFCATSSNVHKHSRHGARHNRLIGLMILAALTIVLAVSLVPSAAPAFPVTPNAPGRWARWDRSAAVDPVRMRAAVREGNPRWRLPAWKGLSAAPTHLASSATGVGRRVRHAVRQLAPVGGFAAGVALANLDMLLIFSGVAITSGY